MERGYLLVGSGAALRTLAAGAGRCGAHCGLLWQDGGHVEAVVQERLDSGTAWGCCCGGGGGGGDGGGGGGVFRPGLGRRQRLVQAAAAAAATVRPRSL